MHILSLVIFSPQPMVMAPIHVVDLLNVPPELRLESRDYSRSGYSSSPSIRPTSENHYRFGRARGFTYPATVDVSIPNIHHSLVNSVR